MERTLPLRGNHEAGRHGGRAGLDLAEDSLGTRTSLSKWVEGNSKAILQKLGLQTEKWRVGEGIIKGRQMTSGQDVKCPTTPFRGETVACGREQPCSP